ncbi:MAG: hypothetical protein NUV80_00855 [Candidatus Berkelbacteria bacterium]|nr:hypothetical protein [Candidatus Berkelbacteria bacterium]
MQNSKQFLQTHNVMPRISFKDGQAHLLSMLNDKIDTIKGTDGEMVEGVKYLVQEENEKKTFFTSSISLIQKLADVKEGENVIVQMKSRKGENGKWQSYYDVQYKGKVGKDMGEEIPVIEENESVPPIPETEELDTGNPMESSEQF